MSSEANLKLISDLGDDFVRRRNAGEQPSISEYTEKYPSLADEIRDFFDAINIVKDLNRASIGEPGPVAGKNAVPDEILPEIDDYRVVREIARGGMGIVYEARQISLDRQVALKVLPNNLIMDKTAVERFHREAKSAAALHHTNIVPVFDIGVQDDLRYYTMQLIYGTPLDQVIQEIMACAKRRVSILLFLILIASFQKNISTKLLEH